jgi:uncharacterized protein
MDTPWEQIPAQRCWELLGTASVGSLALSVRALPVILPVQYYLTGNRLAACLGHHAIPERSLNDAVIAFTASAIDPATRSGWSVQIQGRSLIASYDGSGTACGQPAAAQLVEIEPRTVSGYYVRPCPFISTLPAGPQAPGPRLTPGARQLADVGVPSPGRRGDLSAGMPGTGGTAPRGHRDLRRPEGPAGRDLWPQRPPELRATLGSETPASATEVEQMMITRAAGGQGEPEDQPARANRRRWPGRGARGDRAVAGV